MYCLIENFKESFENLEDSNELDNPIEDLQ